MRFRRPTKTRSQFRGQIHSGPRLRRRAHPRRPLRRRSPVRPQFDGRDRPAPNPFEGAPATHPTAEPIQVRSSGGVTSGHATAAGFWQETDDQGRPGAWFLFVEKDGLYEGRFVKMFRQPGEGEMILTCAKCTGDQKDAPMLGLTIVKGMKRHGNKYADGSILDPRDGTVYHAQMELSDGRAATLGARLSGHSASWPDANLDPAAGRRDRARRHSRGLRRAGSDAEVKLYRRRPERAAGCDIPGQSDQPPASHSKFDDLAGDRVLVSGDRPEREELRIAVVA